MKTKGFTLIELLLGIGIAAVLLTAGTLTITSFRSAQGIEDEARAIVAILQTAQSKAASQEDDSRFGVYFDNTGSSPSYTLYRVDEAKINNVPMPVVDEGSLQVRPLKNGIVFLHPQTATSTNIMFAKGTGKPSTTTAIVLERSADPTDTRTITISGTGRIDY